MSKDRVTTSSSQEPSYGSDGQGNQVSLPDKRRNPRRDPAQSDQTIDRGRGELEHHPASLKEIYLPWLLHQTALDPVKTQVTPFDDIAQPGSAHDGQEDFH